MEDAEAGRVEPAAGLERLHQTLRLEPRFNDLVSVTGLGMISGGVSLVLGPSAPALLVCFALGLLVGLVKLLAGRVPALWPIIPAGSAAIVSLVGFLAIKAGLDVSPASVVLPPLAVFLPGAAITVAMIELSAGDIVSGGSRLAFGAARLLLLVLGVVIAAQTVSATLASSTYADIPFAPLARSLGVILFTIGVCLHFDAPRGSFPWLLLVVGAAWSTQQVSNLVLGSYLSAVLAGAVMVCVARIVASRPAAAPLIVSYTPAFWLLVPASLGLRSLTELAQSTAPSAISDLLLMILTMIAIALGILVGLFISGKRQVYEPH